MIIGGNTIIQVRATKLKWREVAGSIVVMDLEASRYLAVEGSVASVWPKLVDGATLDELVADIVDQYDVAAADASADLIALASDLVERKVLIVRT